MIDGLLRQSWRDTRARFLGGLAILMVLAGGTVYEYPAMKALVSRAAIDEDRRVLGPYVADALDVQQNFRGFVWFQWFRQNLSHVTTLLAALLGSGSLVSRARLGGPLFMLSLPIARRDVVVARAAVGLAQLAVLAFIPSLCIPILAPAVGERYAFGDALAHGIAIVVVASVFFSAALLLSSLLNDRWRPLLAVLGVAVIVAACEEVLGRTSGVGIFRTMNAERYFRGGELPWLGLLASASASVAMLYAAVAAMRRRDF